MSIKILFLEDDLLFAESIVDLLEEESYEVEHFANGQSALDATFNKKFDIYIFDINVPLINGLTLLKELRASADNTPTIFLTSYKDKDTFANGFNSGADDYISKPFDNDELLLRLKALVRRSNIKITNQIGLLSHDEVHKRILYKNQELDLSKKEYELLLLLMRHANSSVPKELILSELWNTCESGSDGAIRVYINRLKQLIPQMKIQNIRGVGYKLVS